MGGEGRWQAEPHGPKGAADRVHARRPPRTLKKPLVLGGLGPRGSLAILGPRAKRSPNVTLKFGVGLPCPERSGD
eukprot:15431626-Alexandrium_andersonii.AAC.1